MKILLALDDSKFSEATVDALTAQVRHEGTSVHVLHVLEMVAFVPTMDNAANLSPDFFAMRQEALAGAKELVERAASKLRSSGFTATFAVEEGDPKDRIVEAAEKFGADLIMLGSHGRKGLQRFLMGSVSEAVARRAHCSVQIVRVK